MDKIKLVIWDLDETFWRGTLSENGAEIISSNVDIVKELTRRGIMNSISSKNDFESAKRVLEEAGVWDFFIFPSINWGPKGESVKKLIEACQLRSPNVLFIDDNFSNRKEVEYYNPGINSLSEKEIPDILLMPELKGKDDKSLSRLKQYKILEEKAKIKESYSDNHTFLMESDIRIRFIKDTKEYRDRVYELINRTNQLNFTKLRLSEDELDVLLNDPEVESTCIHVEDKFGDYGICGFYALEKRKRKLLHFLFSCRILNLGIEAYVFHKLCRPYIDVVGPVAGTLDMKTPIDWITEDHSRFNSRVDIENGNKLRLLMLGGCDLEQMCHYIDCNKFEIIKEFNYPNKQGVEVHREHTAYLREMENLTAADKDELFKLPFGDDKMLNTKLFSDDYDVLVYSALMNYTHELYENKRTGMKIAYGGYMNQDELCDYLNMSTSEKNAFKDNYSFLGLQKPEEFLDDINWIYQRIKRPIIIINGTETENVCQQEPNAAQRHKQMNKVLDNLIEENGDHIKLLDVRKFVHDRRDQKDTIRHYQRPIYVKMAEELMCLLTDKKVKVSIFVRYKQLYKELGIKGVIRSFFNL